MEKTRWIIMCYFSFCFYGVLISSGHACTDGQVRFQYCNETKTDDFAEIYIEVCENGGWDKVCEDTNSSLYTLNWTNICQGVMKNAKNIDTELRLQRHGQSCNTTTTISINSSLIYNGIYGFNCTRGSFIRCKVKVPPIYKTTPFAPSDITVSWNLSRLFWHDGSWRDGCDTRLCKAADRRFPAGYRWMKENKNKTNVISTVPVWSTAAFVNATMDFSLTNLTANKANNIRECADLCLNQTHILQAIAFNNSDCLCITNLAPSQGREEHSSDFQLYKIAEHSVEPSSDKCQPFHAKAELCIVWVGHSDFRVHDCAAYLPFMCYKDGCDCGIGSLLCMVDMANTSRCVCNCDKRNCTSNATDSCYCYGANGHHTKLDKCGDINKIDPRIIIRPTTPEYNSRWIWICLVVILVVAMFFVPGYFCFVRHRKRKRPAANPENAVANCTYGDNDLFLDRDETYNTMDELDPDIDTAWTPVPPSLPLRNKSLLEEYSCPTDVLESQCLIKDGYATTYDDPRRKRTKSDGDVNPDKDICLKGNWKQFSSAKTRFKHSSEDMTVPYQTSEEKCVQIILSKLKGAETVTFKVNNSSKDDTDNNISKSPYNKCLTKTFRVPVGAEFDITRNENSTISADGSTTPNGHKGETSSLSSTACKVSACCDPKKRASVRSDYEDTSVIDGKYGYNRSSQDSIDSYEDTSIVLPISRSCMGKSGLFQEHVCLECIPEEILRRLGIRIIKEEDVYKSCYNFRRSLDRVYEEKVFCVQDDTAESPNKNYFVLAKFDSNFRTSTKNLNKRQQDGVYNMIGQNIALSDASKEVYDHIAHFARATEKSARFGTYRRFSV